MKQLDIEMMHPRKQIVNVIKRIYECGMTTTSGGNISILDNDGNIWVTPSAVDKGSLKEEDIICVKQDGEIEGRHRPSSEFPFHKAIYDVRPDIRAIIHAHPPALVSFSIVRETPNTNIIPQAKGVCGKIGYVPYAIPGSIELGEKIAAEFRDETMQAVILENHGTVLGGTDLLDVYTRFETLEFCGRTIINAKMIGEPVFLKDSQIDLFEAQIYKNDEFNEPVAYSSKERMIREEMVNIVRRACDQGLMISSYGTVSVRLENDDFLITPSNVARWDLSVQDIVQVRDGKIEYGKLASKATNLHKKIYEQHPEVNAIILTQPPHLMAYGTTQMKLDVRTIPESWIFLQDIPSVSFGKQFNGNNSIPETLTKSRPSVLINNDSYLVTGESLLQAFDRLEVAEFSARSLIMGSSIGTLQPIGDKEIEDLERCFFKE